VYATNISQLGASVFPSSVIGVSNINLSKEITHDIAIAISGELIKKFMCADDYFNLKFFHFSQETIGVSIFTKT
jgi:hypothetical protein